MITNLDHGADHDRDARRRLLRAGLGSGEVTRRVDGASGGDDLDWRGSGVLFLAVAGWAVAKLARHGSLLCHAVDLTLNFSILRSLTHEPQFLFNHLAGFSTRRGLKSKGCPRVCMVDDFENWS